MCREADIFASKWRDRGPFRINEKQLDYQPFEKTPAGKPANKPLLSMGYIPRRNDTNGLEPGDLTKFGPIPWQPHYNASAFAVPNPDPSGLGIAYPACPAQRPVVVTTDKGAETMSVRGPSAYSSAAPDQVGQFATRRRSTSNWDAIGTVLQQSVSIGSDEPSFAECSSNLGSTNEGPTPKPWPWPNQAVQLQRAATHEDGIWNVSVFPMGNSDPNVFFVLYSTASDSPTEILLEEAFDYRSVLVFVDPEFRPNRGSIADFVAQGIQLPQDRSDPQSCDIPTISWCDSAGRFEKTIWTSWPQRQVDETKCDIDLAPRLSLHLSSGTAVSLNGDRIEFTPTATAMKLAVTRAASFLNEPTDLLMMTLSDVHLDLHGPRCGRLQADLEIEQSDFFAELGGDVRTVSRVDEQWHVATFPLLEPYPDPHAAYAFRLVLDPVALFDTDRTRMEFDLSKQGQARPSGEGVYIRTSSTAFVNVAGHAVELSPQDATGETLGAGFGFAWSPVVVRKQNSAPSKAHLHEFVPHVRDAHAPYLTPAGAYQVVGLVGSPTGAKDPIQLLPGDVATEFISVQRGTILDFSGGHSALVSPPADVPTTPTTAWVAITAPKSNHVRWCVQPVHGSQYSPGATNQILPAAAPQLKAASHFPPIPMQGLATVIEEVYLGSSGYPEPTGFVAKINGENKLTMLASHASAWAVLRRSILLGDDAPISVGRTGEALQGRTRTPQGLLLSLNSASPSTGQALDATSVLSPAAPPAGSVQRILLAKHSQPGPNQTTVTTRLEVGPQASGYVHVGFQHALAKHNAVVVVADSSVLFPSNVNDGLQIDLFPFDMRGPTGGPPPIAIFKLDPTRSLAEIATEWTDVSEFAPSDDWKTRLTDLVAASTATKEAKRVFADFHKLWIQKDWTGVLFMDCPIKQDKLPADIQMLLGGMKLSSEGLRAHHVGLTLNHIHGSKLELQASSLFGVVFHQRTDYDWTHAAGHEPTKLTFAVPLFVGVIEQSKLTTLQAQAAMTIPTVLGGIAVKLAKVKKPDLDERTIVILGHRIKNADGTAGLGFDTQVKRNLVPDGSQSGHNPLDADQGMEVCDASLAPIGKPVTSAGTTTVKAAFELSGKLHFTSTGDQSLGLDSADVFSYGGAQSLDFQAYRYGITTTIPNEGTPTCTNPELNRAALRLNATSARPKSLADQLQFKVTGWGTPPTVDGNKVLQLNGDTIETGLKFQIPFGPAGALSSANAPKAATIWLGWSIKPETTPTKDKLTQGIVLRLDGIDFLLDGVISSVWDRASTKLVSVNSESAPPASNSNFQGVLCLKFPSFSNDVMGFRLNLLSQDMYVFGNPNHFGSGSLLWYMAAGAGAHGFVANLGLSPFLILGRFSPIVATDDPNGVQSAIDQAKRRFFSGSDASNQPGSFPQALNAITAADGLNDGMFFAINANLLLFKFQLVLDDSGLYGGRLVVQSFGKPKKPKDGEPAPKQTKQELLLRKLARGLHMEKTLEKLNGFEVEVTYHKIRDNLSSYTINVVLPLQGVEATKDVKFWAPNVAFTHWSNNDWELAVGWPMSKNPFKLDVQAGYPWEGRIGFCVGRMNGGDLPTVFGTGTMPLAYEFTKIGVGLGLGLAKNGGGSFYSWSASVIGQLTGDGYIGTLNERGEKWNEALKTWAKANEPTKVAEIMAGGLPGSYRWGLFTLGVTISGNATLGIPGLITLTASFTANVTLALALETRHCAQVALIVTVSAEVSIHFFFFTVHIGISATFEVGDWTIGHGHAASLVSPSMDYAIHMQNVPDPSATTSEGLPVPTPHDVQATQEIDSSEASTTPANPPALETVTLKVAPQATGIVDATGTVTNEVVVLLGVSESDLQKIVPRFVYFVLKKKWVSGQKTLADVANAVKDKLESDDLTVAELEDWPNGLLEFSFSAVGQGDHCNLLPMFPGRWLEVVVNDVPLNRDVFAAPPCDGITWPYETSFAAALFATSWRRAAHVGLEKLAAVGADVKLTGTGVDADWSKISAKVDGLVKNLGGHLSHDSMAGNRVGAPLIGGGEIPIRLPAPALRLAGQMVPLSAGNHTVGVRPADTSQQTAATAPTWISGFTDPVTLSLSSDWFSWCASGDHSLD